jgi:hypothetical protein
VLNTGTVRPHAAAALQSWPVGAWRVASDRWQLVIIAIASNVAWAGHACGADHDVPVCARKATQTSSGRRKRSVARMTTFRGEPNRTIDRLNISKLSAPSTGITTLREIQVVGQVHLAPLSRPSISP